VCSVKPCSINQSIAVFTVVNDYNISVPSVLWYCWLGLLTCKNHLPYNLYCFGGDVKHCSIQSNPIIIYLLLCLWVNSFNWMLALNNFWLIFTYSLMQQVCLYASFLFQTLVFLTTVSFILINIRFYIPLMVAIMLNSLIPTLVMSNKLIFFVFQLSHFTHILFQILWRNIC